MIELNEIDCIMFTKRQALVDDMLKDCIDDPRFLKNLVADYVSSFKEDLVEMLYNNL